MHTDLLAQTREILDGLSSGTLSPVSSSSSSSSPLSPPSSSIDDRLSELRAALREPSLTTLEELDGLDEERFGTAGWTVLHVAARECPQNERVFAALLRRGADALAKDRQGKRARQLLPNSKEAASSPVALMLQEWEARQACVKKEKLFRLCSQASASATATAFKSILSEAAEDGAALLQLAACGVSPLHQLASRDRAGILKRLFSKLPQLILRLPTCLTTLHGNTILHEAARWGCRGCIEEILTAAPSLASLRNHQNALPVDLCSTPALKKLFADTREERKFAKILELLNAGTDDNENENENVKEAQRVKVETDAETEAAVSIVDKDLTSLAAAASTEPSLSSSPRKRGRPRIYQPGQSLSKLRKLRQKALNERSPTRSSLPRKDSTAGASAGAASVNPTEAEATTTTVTAEQPATVLAKRGPGRPRKNSQQPSQQQQQQQQPQPLPLPSQNEVDIVSGKCDLSSTLTGPDTKHHRSVAATKMTIPVNRIFADSIGCVLTVRMRGEWWVFLHQLEAISTWLQRDAPQPSSSGTFGGIPGRSSRSPSLTVSSKLESAAHKPESASLTYTSKLESVSPLTASDRQRFTNLPNLGRLTTYLKTHPLSPLLPKSIAISFLESAHKLALTGPFGYVDVDQLSPPRPAPLPLRLKMKLEAASMFSSDKTGSHQREPRSPKMLQM